MRLMYEKIRTFGETMLFGDNTGLIRGYFMGCLNGLSVPYLDVSVTNPA